MTSAKFRPTELWRATAALTALSACLIGVSTVVHAAVPAAAASSVTVSYGDLNLATAAGASALRARIASAARAVCASESIDIRDLGAFTRARACETAAVAAAVNAVHSPRLASLRIP